MPNQHEPDLLKLTDEFADFKEKCAFLCDAFASISATQQTLDETSVHGMADYCRWIKDFLERHHSALENLRSQV